MRLYPPTKIIRQQSHILQPETSPDGDKEDFAQYEKMISIEEYSFTVILYYRTFTEGTLGSQQAEIGPLAIGVSRLQEIETIDPGT